MGKQRYTILQKKLQELEAELNEARSLPVDTPHHELYSQDIKQRFLFLKALLSAELSSTPTKSPDDDHLQHIDNSLNQLNTLFHHWDDDFKPTSPPQIDNLIPTCNSCFQEEEKQGADDDRENNSMLNGSVSTCNSKGSCCGNIDCYNSVGLKEEEDGAAAGDHETVVRRVGIWKRRRWASGAVAFGMVLLMGYAVMVRFCFESFFDDVSFVVPT